MAINRILEDGRKMSLVVTHPASPSSGNPIRFGQMTGVALTDERTAGDTTVDLGPAVYDLSVKGEDNDGNAAIAVGAQLFYVDGDIGDGTGTLSAKIAGYFYGFLLEAQESGVTSNRNVLMMPSPGPGTADILAGAIGTSELAADAVTGAKIADDQVDSEHYVAASIDSEHYAVGSLSADATGRAVMATDLFDAATILLKIADGAFADDSATRALFADAIWPVAKLAVPKYGVITQSVAFGEFTDVDTKGHIDLTTPMPKGAIPLGCKFVVTTGFTGDTTAIVQAGVSGDTDRFTLNVDQSVLAVATVGSLPATDGADGMAAAQTIRVTVTGGADFSSISAGVMVVSVFYIETE